MILPIIQNVRGLDLDLDLERGERGGRWALTEMSPGFHKNEDNMRIEIRIIIKRIMMRVMRVMRMQSMDWRWEREEEGGR